MVLLVEQLLQTTMLVQDLMELIQAPAELVALVELVMDSHKAETEAVAAVALTMVVKAVAQAQLVDLAPVEVVAGGDGHRCLPAGRASGPSRSRRERRGRRRERRE